MIIKNRKINEILILTNSCLRFENVIWNANYALEVCCELAQLTKVTEDRFKDQNEELIEPASNVVCNVTKTLHFTLQFSKLENVHLTIGFYPQA